VAQQRLAATQHRVNKLEKKKQKEAEAVGLVKLFEPVTTAVVQRAAAHLAAPPTAAAEAAPAAEAAMTKAARKARKAGRKAAEEAAVAPPPARGKENIPAPPAATEAPHRPASPVVAPLSESERRRLAELSQTPPELVHAYGAGTQGVKDHMGQLLGQHLG